MATKGSTSVQIVAGRCLWTNANTSTFEVANGIVQAINKRANIINLSLGSEGDSPFLRDIIKMPFKRKSRFLLPPARTGKRRHSFLRLIRIWSKRGDGSGSPGNWRRTPIVGVS